MKERINFVIITGLSGAGKTKTVQVMEDLGYYCIDNLPPSLINDFLKILMSTEGKMNKLCAVIDVRSRNFLYEFPIVIKELRKERTSILRLFFLRQAQKRL